MNTEKLKAAGIVLTFYTACAAFGYLIGTAMRVGIQKVNDRRYQQSLDQIHNWK